LKSRRQKKPINLLKIRPKLAAINGGYEYYYTCLASVDYWNNTKPFPTKSYFDMVVKCETFSKGIYCLITLWTILIIIFALLTSALSRLPNFSPSGRVSPTPYSNLPNNSLYKSLIVRQITRSPEYPSMVRVLWQDN